MYEFLTSSEFYDYASQNNNESQETTSYSVSCYYVTQTYRQTRLHRHNFDPQYEFPSKAPVHTTEDTRTSVP